MILRAFITLLLVLLAAAPAGAAITEVTSQRTSDRFTSGTTGDAIYPGNVTQNNLLVAAGGCSSVQAAPTVSLSDTRSTAWTVLHLAFTANHRVFVAYGLAPSSGANTVTVTLGGVTDGGCSWVVTEYSGVHTSTPVDVDGGSNSGTSTAPSDGLTTVTDGALIIGAMSRSGGGTVSITPDAAYTQLDEEEDDTNFQAYSAVSRITTTAGAYTVSWTLGASHPWGVYTVAFKPATAGGAPSCRGRLLLLGVGC